ncbi:MAG: Valine--tRNA ligase [candidate division WS6 bacterium OLB21]|uniref:valine--tRNA ligase n=1 Tax=candidate division WS6 bacterium OLB21 TaxID=1617427 RepID=A0A136KHP0_9BACT|nr:MAG: Valine--tRNA ligase [candidate division WS6 bacterium OLB21]
MLTKGPYEATITEESILNYWLENKFFKPEYHPEKGLQTEAEMRADQRDPFTIVNPPPNAYMRPHIGNVSGYAYQDVLLRYNRLLGKKVLGQPGKDHAGIQGEVVVEKIFLENKKKSKQDLGREKFYKASYAHFQKLMPMVMADEKRIGLSSDYERNLFTLDPRVVNTILNTFVSLYSDGMVYKGVRIVNWDPVAKTTLADIDTERVERETELVYIKYPLKQEIDGINHITVATTRAETMLGDTAVIVNPKDERYKKLIGAIVVLPLTNREIPIITSERVESEFGTGAVKLTPAHSYDDYVMMNEWNSVAKENEKIGYINVINKQAKMYGPIPERYNGLSTEEARSKVLVDLEEQGLIEKKEAHTQSVMVGERSKAVIEQIMSSQWFIDVERLKQPAIEAVKSGKIQIHPKYMTKKYLTWMENLHDWPVSRSLWWGYRIPVWYKGELSEDIDEKGQVVETVGGEKVENINDAVNKGLAKIQIDPPGTTFAVIRHGATEHNQEHRLTGRIDTPLSESGIKECEIYANNLQESFDLIISSPQKRAFQTAEIIAAKQNSKPNIITDERLRERDFGIAEGKNWEELIAENPELAKSNSPLFQPELPEAETITEVESRVEDWIKETAEKYTGKKILVVTHAGVYRVIRRQLGGMNADESRTDIANLQMERYHIKEEGWIQDEDVFDTWFSSGQWPYATLRANNINDCFFPTDVMETGHDILELWVSRMIMLSLYTENKIPFKHVYLHGLVKAPDGQKMSKSKGNVIAPEEIITKYGADSLRLLYVVGNRAGSSYPVSYEKLEGYKRFLNKIWNAAKFVLSNLEDLNIDHLANTDIKNLNLAETDRTMLDHMNLLIADTTRRLDNFNLGIAAQELYDSFWHTFADIYLEEVKMRLYTKDKNGNPINTSEQEKQSRFAAQWTLYNCFREYLILLHPFIPFISERIWQDLPKTDKESKTIMYSRWPQR